MVNICPCCGAEMEIPLLFSPRRQAIFGFIWNNPLCTSEEIITAVYDGRKNRWGPTVCVHICAIRRGLKGTGYWMKVVPRDKRVKNYAIMQQRPEKGPANADVNVTTILP